MSYSLNEFVCWLNQRKEELKAINTKETPVKEKLRFNVEMQLINSAKLLIEDFKSFKEF